MEMTAERVNWRDYLELTKPNVVALMILTALIVRGINSRQNCGDSSP